MTCCNMKSNTEVYSQWLDSKVVLEPTHPPGGQLNSTMMTSFTAAEEQDLLGCTQRPPAALRQNTAELQLFLGRWEPALMGPPGCPINSHLIIQ